MENTNDSQNWDLVISSKTRLLDLRLREVLHYRDLILLFIKRDFTVAYKQTILGPLWFLVQPVMSTIMFAFVFGNLAHIGTDGVPFVLFYYAGTMLWNFFTGTLGDAGNVFISNSGIFGKIYFPRLVVPISTTVGQMIKMGIQFMLLMVFYVYYIIKGAGVHPGWGILLFPVIVLWIAMMACGLGIIVSSLTTKYRDLKIVVDYGVGLAMYATPVVYPLSQAPANLRWVFYVNPLSAPIELFRVCFYGAGNVPVPMMIISACTSLALFFTGLVLFNRNERTFVDVI